VAPSVAAPEAAPALQRVAVKHGRIAAEQRTKGLKGRLRAEEPTTERTAPGLHVKPVHPVHPAHPAKPVHVAKKPHAAPREKPAPRPKQHERVTPPAPSHEKKQHDPAVTVPTPTVSTPTETTPAHKN
jgi:hypothetical protein